MSHFSVYVAIPAEKLCNYAKPIDLIEHFVSDALAPYEEGTSNPELLQFKDKTDELLKDYDTDTMQVIRYPDGHLVGSYEKEFYERFKVEDNKILERKPDATFEYWETIASRSLQLIPNYPVKDRLTFEEFCCKYNRYTKNEEGRWGYYYNPNSCWDWFQIGGGMSGSLLALSTALPNVLHSGGDSPAPDYIPVNAARMRDIAWAEMKELRYEAQLQYFNRLQKAFQIGDLSEVGYLTAITEEGIVRWPKVLAYKAGESFEEFLDRTGCAESNEYATSCYSFVTKDGVWHSQGEMGWFGISSDDKTERDWNNEVQEFFSDLNDDDFLVVVDCHI